MRYFLDTEFNEFGGVLLSMAIVREDGRSLYLILPKPDVVGSWVSENVMPIMGSVPSHIVPVHVTPAEASAYLAHFLAGDPWPFIVTDWPDDIRYFCQSVITGPGQMIAVPSLQFAMARVDAYPTELEGAVQHNAWWDAMALRFAMTGLTSGLTP